MFAQAVQTTDLGIHQLWITDQHGTIFTRYTNNAQSTDFAQNSEFENALVVIESQFVLPRNASRHPTESIQ